jgi:hypothetical protein
MTTKNKSVLEEEFEAWLSHPITQAMMQRAAKIEQATREAWMAISWGANIAELQNLPTERLAYLRGKSEAFKSLSALKYRDIFKEDKDQE